MENDNAIVELHLKMYIIILTKSTIDFHIYILMLFMFMLYLYVQGGGVMYVAIKCLFKTLLLGYHFKIRQLETL